MENQKLPHDHHCEMEHHFDHMPAPEAFGATAELFKLLWGLIPIVGFICTAFIVPSGLPLLGMLFFGNLLKESGVTKRLAATVPRTMCRLPNCITSSNMWRRSPARINPE